MPHGRDFLGREVVRRDPINSDAERVLVRYAGEQHVREDLGCIPIVSGWMSAIKPQRWMCGRPLEEEKNASPFVHSRGEQS
jgi:hypothetical protein